MPMNEQAQADRWVRRSVRALRAYTPGEQPDDPSILKLNTNENPYGPSPAAGEVLRNLAADRLRLYPDPVCMGLRRALAELHGCRADQILVGNGSDEVLALCLHALVEPGGSIGYFDPSYSLYPVLAAIADVPARPVRLADDFGWAPPEAAEADLFFLTNPNAPTSLRFPRDEVEAFCDRTPGVVVIDEAYVDFARADCLDLALSRPNVLVTRSLSKSYGLAGIRVGYAVGPAPLIAALFKIKDSYNVNAISQAMALAAVRDQAALRGMVSRVKRTRERTAEALRQRGAWVAASETNFLWLEPPGGDGAGWFRGLRERGVLARYFPGERTGRFLRVTVGTDADMVRFLAAWDGVAGGRG